MEETKGGQVSARAHVFEFAGVVARVRSNDNQGAPRRRLNQTKEMFYYLQVSNVPFFKTHNVSAGRLEERCGAYHKGAILRMLYQCETGLAIFQSSEGHFAKLDFDVVSRPYPSVEPHPFRPGQEFVSKRMKAVEFNGEYPIGSPFVYFPINNDTTVFLPTRTTSQAWNLGHGQPVVKVEGKSGGVCLAHLQPVEEPPESTEVKIDRVLINSEGHAESVEQVLGRSSPITHVQSVYIRDADGWCLAVPAGRHDLEPTALALWSGGSGVGWQWRLKCEPARALEVKSEVSE